MARGVAHLPRRGVLCGTVNSARFRTAAAHYTLGRPTYPADLIASVALACGLNPSDRLLDLGTGPGVLALAFAPYVSWVLAVDPEPEMLRQAQEAVRLAHARVEVRAGSSETLGRSATAESQERLHNAAMRGHRTLRAAGRS